MLCFHLIPLLHHTGDSLNLSIYLPVVCRQTTGFGFVGLYFTGQCIKQCPMLSLKNNIKAIQFLLEQKVCLFCCISFMDPKTTKNVKHVFAY